MAVTVIRPVGSMLVVLESILLGAHQHPLFPLPSLLRYPYSFLRPDLRPGRCDPYKLPATPKATSRACKRASET